MIMENSSVLVVEVSLSFDLPTTNNQVEYEAIIMAVVLAKKMWA